MLRFRTISILLGAFVLVNAGDTRNCKCAPGDSCWPSDGDFEALNQTVSGQLIRGVPPASVCYQDQPDYDESACQTVATSWFESTFHASDPISVGWPWWANNSCPPIFPNGTSVNGDPDAGKKGCTIGGYPVYALNATDPTQIQAVVQFANENNIRLNVKSTGHSFQGRSTAFGSISIWTHNLRGAQWHDSFQPDNCTATNSSQMAATFSAGERVRNVYEFTAAHSAVVVAGSNQDVGIVGWFTGGGHGPLSSSYGMGADNVLEVKVVTPSGDYITANECQNSDLFWALRGGGGGTFGIVTEVTMAAYPSPQTAQHSIVLVAAPDTNSSTFLDVLARILSDFPRLKAGGLQGYINLVPPGYFAELNTWAVVWSLYLYDQPNGTAEALFAPLAQWLDPLNGTVIEYSTTVEQGPDFFTIWNGTIGDETVATGGVAMGSRLLPASALADPERLSLALQNLTAPAEGEYGVPFVQFLAIANSDRGSSSGGEAPVALNPAWRDAVLHVITTEGFPDWVGYEAAKPALDRITYQRVGQLRMLAPNSGAYLNECDPYDPNWQYDFFGENYARLRAIKAKYDPNGSLWCISCVGSEDWVEVEKQSGRLCQAEWAQ
ncbi:hypothetical protein BX600DRAFT_518908 [Xylariales sp. PMI_506]|nr:hypothetical protein BX600DRAFT_518908 [Xylariales sp. PMI_506]